MKKILRLGTRGSPLALIQAQTVREEIYRVHEGLRDVCDIEIIPIRTTGDWSPAQGERSFLEIGGNKGFFTKEIEEALAAGVVDFAVHSMKDVSVWNPPGLVFGAMVKRADPRDALLSAIAPRLEDLPKGARVGTSSLRRKAQILAYRPDLSVVPLRGNVDTRLRKLAAEEADATILAVAGLSRLGVQDKIASILDVKIVLPAVAQGILGIQIRDNDVEIRKWIEPINDKETEICAKAERALLRRLDGSCKTPIAGLAQITKKGTLAMDALAARPDGTELVRVAGEGKIEEAEALGLDLAEQIRRKVPSDIFEG